ncbi:hypothetical protein ABZ595_28630 [Streptomyces rubradiris]|uniref:hypothetical protein n=1 Tax=Streptomyces rubradiris TaxID=285531 RepID=UPI0033BFD636
MSEWSFTLLVNQPLTPEQADAFDHCDAFADGSVSYTMGPENPEDYPHRPDPDKLRELSCDIEAPTLLDAVAQVARDIRLIPGLRAVGVRYDDTVTLEGIPEEPRDLLIADRALRLADVLEGADVPPGALRALGLPIG